MNKKTTGILAGTAGAALLIGGGTFALWSDSADVAGGTITTGNLDIAAIADETEWVDASADRLDKGHVIDVAEWKAVPGDVATGEFYFSAALEGDNLVADLTSTVADASAAWYTVESVASYTTDGTTWVPFAGDVQSFTSEDNVNNVPALPELPAAVGTDANVKVTVKVTVLAGAPNVNQVNTNSTINLGAIAVGLEQTRDAGTGAGF
ncbi:hypothetical protein C8046_10040 [Serinibacter arcticus]|uniref:Alternate signal-mediated exported protein, RER_14450 family n=1 Tax=Serinibacter arcticus TaxID=1655435 RepID=A0A2U1ZVJ3_9MICO|nr:alternate-type signal peptide domain-containing protein [Serinibacter arcticus]PWD50942.1 hypothetical protein C8046_10040 [Serinibacter arcticus]